MPMSSIENEIFCGACHAMDPQVNSYLNSSHKSHATCGDCHTPHDPIYGKVMGAYTGIRDFIGVIKNVDHYEIHAGAQSKGIIHDNCMRCHADVMSHVGDSNLHNGMQCFDCHRNVPHKKYPTDDEVDLVIFAKPMKSSV